MIKLPLFFARRFVAGETLADALSAARQFNSKGIHTTLDHLGEDVTNKRKARKATKTYISILDNIHKHNIDANISVKLSQIGLAIAKRFALRQASQILRRAQKYRLFVEIDMEGSRYTQDTFDIFFDLLGRSKNVMLAVQAYLYRSEDDVKKIITKKGKVRLVKGGYKEPVSIAFVEKEETNRNYTILMKMLLQRRVFLAIATHDEKIIEEARRFIKRKKISKNMFEFEMLYGIHRDLQEELAREGYKVSVYVPYGREWFPYFWRRLRERKENLLFVLKHLFRK